MLIHIGYHKTASSWLQQRFFPRHPQLLLAVDHQALWPHLIEPHPLDFDANECRAILQPDIDQAVAQGRLPVISSERLSGNPHSGGYDSKLIAERLSQVFPGARILIVVRRQADMLCSFYKQYVRSGGICSLAEYLHPVRDGRMPLFRHEHLCYHRLLACYQELFGEDRVLTLVYEQLAADWEGFLDVLCDFLGIDKTYPAGMQQVVEPSSCDLAIALKRRINRWHGNDSLYPVTPGFPRLTQLLFSGVNQLNRNPLSRGVDCHYLEYCEHYARDKYEHSNRLLQQLMNGDPSRCDLSEYGYAL